MHIIENKWANRLSEMLLQMHCGVKYRAKVKNTLNTWYRLQSIGRIKLAEHKKKGKTCWFTVLLRTHYFASNGLFFCSPCHWCYISKQILPYVSNNVQILQKGFRYIWNRYVNLAHSMLTTSSIYILRATMTAVCALKSNKPYDNVKRRVNNCTL